MNPDYKYLDKSQEIFFKIEESHKIEIIFNLHNTIFRYHTPEDTKEINLKVTDKNELIISEVITLLTLTGHKINYFLR